MTRGDTNDAREVRSGDVDAALSTTAPTKGGDSLTWKGVKRTVESMGPFHRPVYAAKAS